MSSACNGRGYRPVRRIEKGSCNIDKEFFLDITVVRHNNMRGKERIVAIMGFPVCFRVSARLRWEPARLSVSLGDRAWGRMLGRPWSLENRQLISELDTDSDPRQLATA